MHIDEITGQDQNPLAKYNVKPEDVDFYYRVFGGVQGALAHLEQDRIRGSIRRAEDRMIDKMPRLLANIKNLPGPINYRTACALIANDDELMGFLDGWTWNADHGEEHPDLAARFLVILKRMNPVTAHLYRGQNSFDQQRNDHTRGFHSWSANRDTALQFAEKGGRVLEINRPVQGVALADILTWRMRLRQGESHYAGPQAEWFVVDQPEQRMALDKASKVN